MTPRYTPRRIQPHAVDAITEEVLYSLMDGRAKHTVRHIQRLEDEQERAKHKVTLAPIYDRLYLV